MDEAAVVREAKLVLEEAAHGKRQNRDRQQAAQPRRRVGSGFTVGKRRPVRDTGEGNPPHLIGLADGRLCLTYGVRAAPYRICAKLSADAGRTWSAETVLRDDGGNRDIGYVRTVQRPDGKLVTVYYFWDQKTGPERYLAATIWEP